MHLGGFLQEIFNNETAGALKQGAIHLTLLMNQVANRCAQLNDPVLDRLMCDLSLYTVADGYSPEYNREVIDKVEERYEKYVIRMKKKREKEK